MFVEVLIESVFNILIEYVFLKVLSVSCRDGGTNI